MAKGKKVHHVADGSWGNGRIERRGDRWRIRWRENGQRMSLSGFESRAEAADKLAEIQRRVELSMPGVEPKPVVSPKVTIPQDEGDRSFADLLEDFIAYRVAHKRRMAAEDRTRWQLHLAQPLETQTVKGLTSDWVRWLAGELVSPTPGTKAPDGAKKDPISGPTATRVLALLSAFFQWAIRQRHAEKNPVREVLSDPDIKARLASSHDKAKRATLKSWGDVDRLYGAMGRNSVGLAFYLCARAGLRPGEAYALRWGSVDLERGVVLVGRSVRSGKEGTTKSGKPRPVPLSPKLRAELAKWREKSEPVTETDLVCPPPARVKRDGSAGERMGRYLGKRTIGAALKAAFKATKIKPADMYTIGRHTFGTLVGASGDVSAARLQAIMGHASITTTLRYINLAEQPLTAKELAAFG